MKTFKKFIEGVLDESFGNRPIFTNEAEWKEAAKRRGYRVFADMSHPHGKNLQYHVAVDHQGNFRGEWGRLDGHGHLESRE